MSFPIFFFPDILPEMIIPDDFIPEITLDGISVPEIIILHVTHDDFYS